MKEIKLTRGMVAIVDDEDFEDLSKYNWQAFKGRYTYYAARGTPKNGKKWKGKVMMHRQIMNAKRGEVIDHKNRNGLDNQKSNIRKCTYSENQKNKKPSKNSTSKYLGVCKHKISGKWVAQSRFYGKHKYLGLFDTEEEAAKAYNDYTSKQTTFCNLNILNEHPELLTK